jgi:putative FmdB family regulatory protein
MPTYEYICENCGYEFEQFQYMTARPLRKCPECGKANLKRLIGCGSGVIFKGSGFYQTDYRSESYTKAEKSEKDIGDTDSVKKGTKHESKDSKPSEKNKQGTKNEKGASS